MAAANGTDSYVAQDFPLGAAGIPVKASQLLGYQGTWSGKSFWPRWLHMHFAVVRAEDGNEFPHELVLEDILDPTLYMNLELEPRTENENPQSLKCKQP